MKIVLSGYYGFNNAGDEAILYSIISCLKELKPDIEITVLSNDPASTCKSYDVLAVNRWDLREVVRAISKSDVFVSGGGSLLQDVTGIKSLLYYLALIVLAYLLKKPVFFYAHGIGPINTPLGRFLTRTIVNNCVSSITVRDDGSKKELHSIGVKKHITVTADPVLGVNITQKIQKKGLDLVKKLGMDSQKEMLIVSVRNWQGNETLYKELALCCDGYAKRGGQVLFLPMHFPHDLSACRRVAKNMQSKYFMAEDEYTVEQLLGVYCLAKTVIGMRLHSLIMAVACGVPVIGISYDPKIERFLEQIGRKAVCNVKNNSDFKKMCIELNYIIDNWNEEKKHIQQKLDTIKKRALKSAEMLLGLYRDN